jgi:RNA polymerase sigma factor (sigma-70 family)
VVERFPPLRRHLLSVGSELDGRREHRAHDIEALYRAHRERLVGLAAAITLNPNTAEDVVHDAFVGLQRHRGGVTMPLAYLRRSVVNLSVSRLRRQRVTGGTAALPNVALDSPEGNDIWHVVVKLPAKQRAVVVLRYWEDMKVGDIAEVLGTAEGSVKSSLHRALARLRKELA